MFFNKFNRFHKRNFLRNPIDSSEFHRLSIDVRNQMNLPRNLYKHFIISPYKKSYDKITNINNIRKFENYLMKDGFNFYKQLGFYMGDVEPSYIVECPLFNAIKYGNMFNQDSIIGLNYDSIKPSVSDTAIYIDLKERSWTKMKIQRQVYPMSVEEFFFRELEGSYVIYKRFYYFYEFDNVKGNL